MISLNKKRILVTGGTGFIGSYLCRRLVRDGAYIYIIAREGDNDYLIRDIGHIIKVFFIDIRDYDRLLDVITQIQPKIIYHLSAMVNVETDLDLINPLLEVNLNGTLNLIKGCIKAGGVEKFVYVSTSDVYGYRVDALTEDSMQSPISLYGASKSCAEMFCLTLSKLYNIPLVILRPFIVYGGGQSPTMFIPQLIQSALKGKDFLMTEGRQKRDFLYIDDFVDACINAVIYEKAEGEIINIASGTEISLAEVAEKVMSMLGNPTKIRFGAIPYRDNERWVVRADIKKARMLLDWQPRIDFHEGIRRTINWYIVHREWLQ
ncbi:MAG: NAD(P)-dependent oxidoreductase [Thermodesulfovibrionia bacterium]